jgi:hypothetical protein
MTLGSIDAEGVTVRQGQEFFPLEFLDGMAAATFCYMESNPPRVDGQLKQKYLRAYPLIGQSHPVIEFATDSAVVKPLARYMGHWPELVYATVFHYLLNDDPALGHQAFHRDPGEVAKYGRIVVYLNDVDMDGGPFCYVPGTHPDGRFAKVEPEKFEHFESRGERERRYSDEEVRRVLPHWEYFPGPKYTMIYADTKGIHKGLKPTKRDRVALILGYN